MSLPELQEMAVEWAAAEGWNPGLHDAPGFYAADSEGFLGGWLNGKPIACISAVRYPPDFGFVGFYIVRPDYRGKGYGLEIWNAAMQQLAGCNIGLDGVVAQQENYKRSGFTFAYNNIRFEGFSTGKPTPKTGANLVPCDQIDFESLLAYDRQYFPANRPEFLAAWLRQPDSVALAALAENQIQGYGMIRPCRKGYKIGPLFAETAGVAEQLLHALCGQISLQSPYYLDVPAINPEAVALAGRHGMQPVFETARMYTGSTPDVNLNGVFGVTTFELG
ncbi:GNAT family N-acetyltransferase [Larkinella terrae]|uniref:GNAT family N-acetyltransferase n=2 Tax=Larkinella terrae TaxID=2025311 RepID=A0A7K0ESH8_9BACT|nr:GNAT family N-acetyltransferase [Larkinella terrae]